MTITKPFWQSTTFQGVAASALAAVPTAMASALNGSDPIWGVLEDVGATPEQIGWIKLAVLGVGLVMTIWGRMKANTRVTLA